MAQVLISQNITDYHFGDNVYAEQAAFVYEADASDIDGNSANNAPYVAPYIQVRAHSGGTVTLGNDGALQITAVYTDGSREQLTVDTAPFSVYGAVPNQAAWVQVYGDGKVRAASAPSNTVTLTASATPADQQRLALDKDKTLEALSYSWNANL